MGTQLYSLTDIKDLALKVFYKNKKYFELNNYHNNIDVIKERLKDIIDFEKRVDKLQEENLIKLEIELPNFKSKIDKQFSKELELIRINLGYYENNSKVFDSADWLIIEKNDLVQVYSRHIYYKEYLLLLKQNFKEDQHQKKTVINKYFTLISNNLSLERTSITTNIDIKNEYSNNDKPKQNNDIIGLDIPEQTVQVIPV